MRQRALAGVSNKLPLFASCTVLEAFSLPARGFGHRAQQRGGQYICDFGEGEIRAIKHIFFQKVPANLVKLLLVTRNSCYNERQKSPNNKLSLHINREVKSESVSHSVTSDSL